MNWPRLIICITISVLSGITAWGDRIIVPDAFCKTKDFHLASAFLNHYAGLLTSDRTEAVNDSIRRAKDDGFRYIRGNDRTLLSVTPADNFCIELKNAMYRATWQRNGNDLVICTFPANIGLLTFSSKIDLENNFIKRLTGARAVPDSVTVPKYSLENLEKISFSDFYVDDKGYYITPRLKHQIIVSDNDGEGVIMNNAEVYPLETLSNIILTGFSPDVISAHVEVSQYGYKSFYYDIPYSAFHSLMSDEGSIPYWGLDTFDGSIVKGICIWINKPGGYAHVMNISIPIDAIKSHSKADIKLHCYIRLDNLKFLFEEYPDL